ncbi:MULTISPECIES: preprotein translocase subunit SecE [Lactobacillaceae]|uniref:preprotein translocase subunit SecE n=1 Tax=Lactobacillaceae TaxID=33958 RepID=UPI000C1B66C0|nr:MULTISPECIES: preprotein translocase subunit SecE [Lactobacillaceae]
MRLFKFFGSVIDEMKLVVWPTYKENRRDTTTVIATSVMYGIFFAIIDWILLFVLQHLIMGK